MKKFIASVALALAICTSVSAGDLETVPKVDPTPPPAPIQEPSTASTTPEPEWETEILEMIGTIIVFTLQ